MDIPNRGGRLGLKLALASGRGSMCQIRVADFRPDTQVGTGSKLGPFVLESLLGIVDGRGNAKVAQQLSALIPNYLAEERLNPDTNKDYLKHTFLSVHRYLLLPYSSRISS